MINLPTGNRNLHLKKLNLKCIHPKTLSMLVAILYLGPKLSSSSSLWTCCGACWGFGDPVNLNKSSEAVITLSNASDSGQEFESTDKGYMKPHIGEATP